MTYSPLAAPTETRDVGELTSDHPAILRAANFAYRAVALERDLPLSKVHKRPGICNYLPYELRRYLWEEEGYRFDYVWRDIKPRGVHNFLAGYSEVKGLVWAEGSWQQFLPFWKRRSHLPRVVVGIPEEVVEFLTESGIREYDLPFWQRERTNQVIGQAAGGILKKYFQ